MVKRKNILASDDRAKLVHAVGKIQRQISWKVGKDVAQLNKRRQMQHLQPSATMLEYKEIILEFVRNGQNTVYLYEFSGDHYYVARGVTHNREWLVIFGGGGLMETAFPPEDMDDYIERRGFVLLGRIDEVLKWAEEENK